MDCTAAILAGGRARRLGGREKALLPLGDLRIVDRQLAAIRSVTDRILIVTNEPGRFEDLDIATAPDLVPAAGPLGGLYTALSVAGTDQILVIACDLPFITAAFLDHVRSAGRDADAAVPRTPDGYQPLCASYTRLCLPAIRRRLETGAFAVNGILNDVRVREIGPEAIKAFDPEGTLFVNVNTPEEYARAAALVERRRA